MIVYVSSAYIRVHETCVHNASGAAPRGSVHSEEKETSSCKSKKSKTTKEHEDNYLSPPRGVTASMLTNKKSDKKAPFSTARRRSAHRDRKDGTAKVSKTQQREENINDFNFLSPEDPLNTPICYLALIFCHMDH